MKYKGHSYLENMKNVIQGLALPLGEVGVELKGLRHLVSAGLP